MFCSIHGSFIDFCQGDSAIAGFTALSMGGKKNKTETTTTQKPHYTTPELLIDNEAMFLDYIWLCSKFNDGCFSLKKKKVYHLKTCI